MSTGTLFVISAPSGAGKSTLLERIRPLFPDMRYSISCTTRRPREGEVAGVNYHFVDRDGFEEIREGQGFLEWKEVHGNLYGTPVGPVEEVLSYGGRMILDIDVQGAREVFVRFPSAVGIFVMAPDFRVLEQRLRDRGADSEESIRLRVKNAREEVTHAGLFPHRIVNDELEPAVQELVEIIRSNSGL